MRTIQGLGVIGPGSRGAIDALVQVLETPFALEVQQAAVQSLGELAVNDSTTIDALLRVLSAAEQLDLRQVVIESLGEIGRQHQGAIKALVHLVDKGQLDGETYYAATRSLAKIGGGSSDVMQLYTQQLRSALDEHSVWQIIEWLGEAGANTHDSGAVRVLTELVEPTQEETVRWRAACSLAKVDPGNTYAVDTLLELLRSCQDEASCQKETPFNAARTLEELGSSREVATHILVELLRASPTIHTQRAVVSCLSHIGVGQPEAIAALIDILQTTQDETLLVDAAWALAKVGAGKSDAADALSKLLRNETPKIHAYLVQHLHEIGAGNAIIRQALIDLLYAIRDKERFAYNMTVQCLEKVAQGEQDAVDALIDLLDRLHSDSNRQYTVRALGKIGARNQLAAEALIKVLCTTQDRDTLAAAARNLESVLSHDLFSLAITGLKDCLQEHVREHDFARYQASFQVLWYCAHNLSYPDFHHAWYMGEKQVEVRP
jgi:HEAT repeat protein